MSIEHYTFATTPVARATAQIALRVSPHICLPKEPYILIKHAQNSYVSMKKPVHSCQKSPIYLSNEPFTTPAQHMGWLWLVGSLKL